MLLVGTKIDLRDDPNAVETLRAEGKELITTQQGEDMAKEISALQYLECSALTRAGFFFLFLATSQIVCVYDTFTTFVPLSRCVIISCSFLTPFPCVGLKNVFDEALQVVIGSRGGGGGGGGRAPPARRRGCSIL